MSERFMEPVLKTGDRATCRGFESHSLRHVSRTPVGAADTLLGLSGREGDPAPGPSSEGGKVFKKFAKKVLTHRSSHGIISKR